MNHEWSCRSAPSSAVPVLPPTSMPSILARLPVPLSTTPFMSLRSSRAWSGVSGSLIFFSLVVSSGFRSGAWTCWTRYGRISVPSFAAAAAIIAPCSAVIFTSRWPMLDWASAGGSGMSPSWLVATGCDTDRSSSSKPKALAMSLILSAPSSTPSFA